MKTAVLLLCACALHAQVATEANQGYRTEQQRGRMAAGLGRENRDRQQKPKELIEKMDLKPGDAVADVGTGVGYMVPFLSRAVGPSGKVYAQDIFPDFLEKAKARNKDVPNVTYVKGTETDPLLPEGAFDRILLLDVYHHFDYPAKMLAALYKSLKPDGRLVIVEYYRSEKAMAGGRALKHVRVDKPDAVREFEASRFRVVSEWEHIKDSQYGLVLEKRR